VPEGALNKTGDVQLLIEFAGEIVAEVNSVVVLELPIQPLVLDMAAT
jgi:hypothetical protein